MTENMAASPSSNTFLGVISVAMLTSQLQYPPLQYPPRVDQYKVQQPLGTYSDFMEKLARPVGADHFAQQMAAIYSSFTQRQERLGAEFEAAIFSDLESLYEA